MADKTLKLDLERTKHYYGLATKAYEDVKSLYNSVLQFTDPFLTLETQVPTETKIKSRRKLYTDITDPLDTLNSFIMNSFLARGSKWASLSYALEKQEENEGDEKSAKEEVSTEAEIELEENIDVSYNYIEQSNYYTVISRALHDSVTLGTGCFRVLERQSSRKPFVYKYVSIQNLYIYDDSFGKPNFIFNDLGSVSIEKVKDMYGEEVKTPSSGEEYKTTIDIVEVVMPQFDEVTGETKFIFAVLGDGMKSILFQEVRTTNPFVVFR